MAEHITEWLGAYLDGELHGARLDQVEKHLKTCEICQAELNSLRSLSALLQADSPRGDFLPSDRFAAQVALRLPRRPLVPPRQKAAEIGGWLVPAGILGAWVFFQVVVIVSGMLTTADQLGLLGSAASWLPSTSQHGILAASAFSLLDGNLDAAVRQMLQVLDLAEVFGQSFFMQAAWQIAIAVLYWGWLITWWLRRQRQNKPDRPGLPQ